MYEVSCIKIVLVFLIEIYFLVKGSSYQISQGDEKHSIWTIVNNIITLYGDRWVVCIEYRIELANDHVVHLKLM